MQQLLSPDVQQFTGFKSWTGKVIAGLEGLEGNPESSRDFLKRVAPSDSIPVSRTGLGLSNLSILSYRQGRKLVCGNSFDQVQYFRAHPNRNLQMIGRIAWRGRISPKFWIQ